MRLNHSFTFYMILLSLFLVPIVYFKTYVGPIPVAIEIIMIPLVTLAFVYDFWKKRIELNDVRIGPMALAFLLFSVIALISIVQAVNITSAVMELLRFLSYVVLFLIVIKVRFTKEEYYQFAKSFGLAVVIVGVYGILQYVFNFSLNKAGLYALSEAKGRVDSTLINPNYYSSFLNFVIPTLVLLAVVYFKNWKIQLLTFALYGIYVANLILTYTRAAWVTMACAFLLMVILIPKEFFKNVIKPHILVAFATLFVIVFNMPDFQQRTNSALYALEKLVFPNQKAHVSHGEHGDDEDGTEDIGEEDMEEEEKKEDATTNRAVVSRTTLWKTGWVMLKDNPLTGVGMGNYLDNYKEYVTKYPELDIGHDAYSVHNSYLKVGAETGFPGLISFLLIYVIYFLYIIKAYLKQNLLGKVLAIGLFVGSVTFMVQNLSNNLMFIPQLNTIFWLVSGLVLAFLYENKKTRLN